MSKVPTREVNRCAFALFACLLSLLACCDLFAQPGVDEFNPMVGSDFAGARAIAIQAGGSVCIGGGFYSAGSEPDTDLARLNRDGTLDTRLAYAAHEIVNALVVQPDGKILLAGGFTQIRGQTGNGIARLNADGTLGTGARTRPPGRYGRLVHQPEQTVPQPHTPAEGRRVSGWLI